MNHLIRLTKEVLREIDSQTLTDCDKLKLEPLRDAALALSRMLSHALMDESSPLPLNESSELVVLQSRLNRSIEQLSRRLNSWETQL